MLCGLMNRRAVQSFLEETEQYHERLYHIAYSQMNDVHDAEDAVQEALIKAARKHEQFEGKSGLYTWLVRIVINQCHDMRRKRTRIRQRSVSMVSENEEKVLEIPDARRDPEKNAELSDESQRLMDVIGQLKDIYRDVVLLRYFEEMNYSEIATTLEISEGTVKSRLNQARKLLRTELEKTGIKGAYFES